MIPCVKISCELRSTLGLYLLERVESDVQAPSGFLMTDLRYPVDVLEDKLDGRAAVLAVNDVALLVQDKVGCGRAR